MFHNPSCQLRSFTPNAEVPFQFLLANFERFVYSADEWDRDWIIDSASVIDVVIVMNSVTNL